MSEHPQQVEISAGNWVHALTFTANGEYLVSGGDGAVGVWRVKDGERVATMPMKGSVLSIAASKDGRYIAAGTRSYGGEVSVWNAATFDTERFFADKDFTWPVADVDFSPDSTLLVAAEFGPRGSAIIWDVAACQRVRSVDHGWIGAAKYSPQGDHIATATGESVRVWDSDQGQLLVNINVGPLDPWQALFWSNHHLFVVTKDSKIKEVDAATGSTISEWPVPCDEGSISLPQHGKFIARCTPDTITFWDTLTHTQLSLILHIPSGCSITHSPDDEFLAIAAEKGEIIIRNLSFVAEPDIRIDDAAFHAWKCGQLTIAEAILSAAISTSEDTSHHVLASRSLIRARLGRWDDAHVDAEESIGIQPSVAGYIAKYVALVGKGEAHDGCRVCDIASQRFHSHLVTLSLIKAVVLFMAGYYDDAMSRIGNLITEGFPESTLYVVQAYMHLLRGNAYMVSGNYERAIQLFQDARVQLGNRTHPPPLIISLVSGWKFNDLATTIQRCLCEALLAADRPKEAAESVLRMVHLGINTADLKTWVSDFSSRCCHKLENLGDNALKGRKYEEAIMQYTTALLLDPLIPQDLLIKRSKARAGKGLWKDALNDANKVILLDPSSPLGYERRYHASCGAGEFSDAMDAFNTMLFKMSESFDPEIRERSRHYVRPEETKEAIRTSIENATRDSPLVLINTVSGRLCNKSDQKSAFESLPIFAELISSTTTDINHAHIEQEVKKFYRYTTFSHTWQDNEPLFAKVNKVVVYDLEALPTHEKLQMFCKIVRDMGFDWAWSDTCCIDKRDHFILQEALVSMFKWYEGSAMTIIFLLDVDHLAGHGAMMGSRWNSRGWTLQEYHASKVVRFYTKDWTPYLGLDLYNHKDSPEIISEMEKATGVLAEALKALRPGLDSIREKLRLASERQTTRVEDAAYSLLGIFSMTLPVTYGEGDRALGRLLSQLLMTSGDASVLAWNGKSGGFNSCLPADIIVFSTSPASHIPPTISNADVGVTTAGLASSLDLTSVTRLYDQLNGLPMPFFVGQRMKLPCLTFKVRLTSAARNEPGYIFHAQTTMLGAVEIQSQENLLRLGSLYLVHPWIDFLLDRHPVGSMVEMAEEDALDELHSLHIHSSLDEDPLDAGPRSPMDKEMRILEFVARLRRPFGPLLLAPTRRNVEEYKRVATESLMTVQVEEITSATLEGLIQGVRVLDVL